MTKTITFLTLIITLLIPSYAYSKDISWKEYLLRSREVIGIMDDSLDDLNILVDMIHTMTDFQCFKHLSSINSEWRRARRKLEQITPPTKAQYVHNLLSETLDKYTKSTQYMIKSCRGPFSKNEYFVESVFLMRQGDRLFSKAKNEFNKIEESETNIWTTLQNLLSENFC